MTAFIAKTQNRLANFFFIVGLIFALIGLVSTIILLFSKDYFRHMAYATTGMGYIIIFAASVLFAKLFWPRPHFEEEEEEEEKEEPQKVLPVENEVQKPKKVLTTYTDIQKRILRASGLTLKNIEEDKILIEEFYAKYGNQPINVWDELLVLIKVYNKPPTKEAYSKFRIQILTIRGKAIRFWQAREKLKIKERPVNLSKKTKPRPTDMPPKGFTIELDNKIPAQK